MVPMSSDQSSPVSAAKLLSGVTLQSGWTIGKRLGQVDPAHTPGFFSVGYEASRPALDRSGAAKLGQTERAFLKAFDIDSVIELGGRKTDPTSMMQALSELTHAFNSENALLDFCKVSRLDRIVKAIDRGFVAPPATSVQGFPVPYLLFELAEGDIRRFVGASAAADDKWRLVHLHQVAVGLQQLHSNKIAHQDLKPANVLVFEMEGAKIADLGRASRAGSPSPHDESPIPGDRRYAPPELRYGERPTAWTDRREATDIYHLGSLLSFLFTGVQVNTGLYHHLPASLHFEVWRGRYEEVLPHLEAAFTKVLADAEPLFPEWGRSELTAMLSQMCTPNYKYRGDPTARLQAGNPIGLDRFIARFDRLSKRASVLLGQMR